MPSHEAINLINKLMDEKRILMKAPREQNPLLAEYRRIYEERQAVDRAGRETPLGDRLALTEVLADGVRSEWLRLPDHDPAKIKDRVMLFLHGGGFTTGSAVSRRAFCANITRKACVDSFSINYRQAPEYRYPSSLEDCVSAYLWLLKSGYAPERITVVGESAGATLALSLVHFLRDHYFPLPGGVCAYSPAVDINYNPLLESHVRNFNKDALIGAPVSDDVIEAMLAAFRSGKEPPEFSAFREMYITEEEARTAYASPIMGNYSGFPRLMIQTGECDMLLDDALILHRKAESAGVDTLLHVWEGLFHVFAFFDMPESEALCGEIAEFVAGKGAYAA